MGIYRVFSTKDNTITNAFKLDLRTRATQSNMGASDILEVFSIYGAQSSDSMVDGATSASTRHPSVLIPADTSTSSSVSIGESSAIYEYLYKLGTEPQRRGFGLDRMQLAINRKR